MHYNDATTSAKKAFSDLVAINGGEANKDGQG